MTADRFTHGRSSDWHQNPTRNSQYDRSRFHFSYTGQYLTSSGWIVHAPTIHMTSGQAVPRQSVREFVRSEVAQRALQAFGEVVAKSISDTYREAPQQYTKWENTMLRRKLRELEQNNEDLRRALLATGQLRSPDMRAEFNELAEQWHDETGHMSSAISFTQHPAYLRIIAMGPAVVPFILEDLERTHGHWFVALRLITGENPIKPEDKGKVQQLANAWIEWGRERGLV